MNRTGSDEMERGKDVFDEFGIDLSETDWKDDDLEDEGDGEQPD